MFQKPAKISKVEADANYRLIKSLPCEVCAKTPVEAHHWKTRGAGGQDTLDNLHPLCMVCHRQFHQMGAKTFWKKYGKAIEWYRQRKGLPPVNP